MGEFPTGVFLLCNEIDDYYTAGAIAPGDFMATVRYLVQDVDKSLPFYIALGFEIADRWGPPFVILRRGDLDLWLSGPETSAAKQLPDGSTPIPGGWNRIVLLVTNLNAAIESVRSAGARFRSEPIQGPGGTQVLVEDLSGNPIELFQPGSE